VIAFKHAKIICNEIYILKINLEINIKKKVIAFKHAKIICNEIYILKINLEINISNVLEILKNN
jgi:hypothetical protein